MLSYFGTCRKLRDAREDVWQEMMRTKKEITESSFLKVCNVCEILTEGETWKQYKDTAFQQGTPINFYKSLNGFYFFQTTGFEFIWGGDILYAPGLANTG
jgi:hypothetical protein